MPPRKKATADNVDPPQPTRTSARNQAKAAAAAASAGTSQAATDTADTAVAITDATVTKPASKPASKAKAPASRAKAPTSKAKTTKVATAPVSKGKGKRSREEDEDEEVSKGEPEAKKVKADPAVTTDAADAAAEPEDDKMDDKEDDKPAEPPAKMVTVIKRGAAPVDSRSGWVDTHQVLADKDGIWDAMLNQTDVGKNANKFYVIQVLHPVGNENSCTLFTCWGRVGETGQTQRKGPFPSYTAVNEFKKQFKAKSGTDWERRHGMIAKKGKYTWLERDFEDDDKKDNDKPKSKAGPSGSDQPEEIPDSKLTQEVQALCKLIFSTKLMDAHLSSMNYDANKLPLGKLAKSTILNGFAALKALSEVISDPNSTTAKEYGGFRQAVDQLTGRYYSIIPHIFGRNRPTIIDDMTVLKRELELVDALGDMEVASKLISSTVLTDESGKPMNPLDGHFRSLRLTTMDAIDRSSVEFSGLEQYARETHGSTHSYMKVNLQHAYRVERQDETDAWNAAGFDTLADGDRMLLWHGSRTTNFAGILKQGLRIAPPEAPVSGYMFGKGVYFADMMSKSAGYCHAHLSDQTGLLLLCEVAVRPFLEHQHANYNADRDSRAANCRSTKGVGRVQPADWQDAGARLENNELKGVWMPKGQGQETGQNASLWYNEYIVYDTSQIRVRYLLMVKMT